MNKSKKYPENNALPRSQISQVSVGLSHADWYSWGNMLKKTSWWGFRESINFGYDQETPMTSTFVGDHDLEFAFRFCHEDEPTTGEFEFGRVVNVSREMTPDQFLSTLEHFVDWEE